MKGHSRGTEMYCPNCKKVRACNAVNPSLFGESSDQRCSYGGIPLFRRARTCQNCAHHWMTVEVPESYIGELVELRKQIAQVNATDRVESSRKTEDMGTTDRVDPSAPSPVSEKDLKRFLSKVSKEPGEGCWIWTRARSKSRSPGSKAKYGVFWLLGKSQNSHTASYRMFVGQIPPGMIVMHRCDVQECVNPKHLSLGYQAENMADKIRKNRYWKKGT